MYPARLYALEDPASQSDCSAMRLHELCHGVTEGGVATAGFLAQTELKRNSCPLAFLLCSFPVISSAIYSLVSGESWAKVWQDLRLINHLQTSEGLIALLGKGKLEAWTGVSRCLIYWLKLLSF